MPTPRIQQRAASQSREAEVELTIAASAQAASRALRASPVVLHFFRDNWCSFGEESTSGIAASVCGY